MVINKYDTTVGTCTDSFTIVRSSSSSFAPGSLSSSLTLGGQSFLLMQSKRENSTTPPRLLLHVDKESEPPLKADIFPPR